MTWQLRIYTSLNLEEKIPKVVSDLTGVLSSPAFISFLEERKVSYSITQNFNEIVSSTTSKKYQLIITLNTEIPSFVSSKISYRKFNFSDLPLNGELGILLSELSTSTIVILLDYLFSTEPHTVISKNNISTLILESETFSKISEIKDLFKSVIDLLSTEPNYKNVLLLAKQWGKLIYLSCIFKKYDYLELIPQIDAYTNQFLKEGKMEEMFYASTAKNPLSLDRILANIKSENVPKIALLCFDCMGCSEWMLLKDFLSSLNFKIEEKEVFSLLPTVTAISRSALYHGSRDVYNIISPGQRDESKSFAELFSERETKYFTESDDITENSLLGYNCISLLYGFFDELCHSTHFPPEEKTKELYFDAVSSYLQKSPLKSHFQTLCSTGFTIYCCSDHGSVVAVGNGQKIEKYLIDNFAKRACIIPESSSELVQFNKMKIPFVDDKVMVLPEGRTMFSQKGIVEINHGGATVEEMVVPYIKLKK
jgi:hypothetical protein